MAGMDLRTYQKKLAGLIRGNYAVGQADDNHLQSVAGSVNLEVTREVILEWRRLSIEHYCRLTSGALKQLGLFSVETRNFPASGDFSSYAEEFGNDFLAALEMHNHELVASVAGFERALIDIQQGTRDQVTLQWRHDPYAVLDAIMKGSGLSALQPVNLYEIHVGKDVDGLFQVIKHRDRRHALTVVR
jgi:hypothetical protein